MKAKLMTKLALAAAVVALGLGAQAEILYWTATGVSSTEDKPMSDSNPYTAYFFLYKGYTPSGTDWVDKKNTVEALVTGRGDFTSWIDDNNYYLRTATSTTGSFSGKDDSAGQFTTSYKTTAFGIVINADTLANATQYMMLKAENGNYYTSITGLKQDWTTLKEMSFGSQSDNIWLTIPEPTSGVLLLVGVAALALKRKKAA